MVVDSIGIYELIGPYCMLTMTKWFLKALSVIPRGSWGDVARRFTMIRWVSPKMWFRSHKCCEPTASCIPEPLRVTQVLVSQFPRRRRRRLPPPPHAAVVGNLVPTIPASRFRPFLVQIDEGIGIPVVDRIRRPKPPTVEVLIFS
ncbi:hypothetical protein F511_02741 [Dorcoceras hygrometricum]|uniref:Uncharacterized protein n=1 Tax=Dorcoceras hygrometricum TaxID=472368 RepID=A0A2Z7DE90_9LAMI|nr:hypothetical protein F511_02741 [Dorcoceras hygrometricum]